MLSSLRLRLTLWYTALLALPLVIFAVICYAVFSSALLSRTDRFIGDALSAFSRELLAERRANRTLEDAMHTTLAEVRFPDLRIAILDTAGSIVASTATHDDVADRPAPPAMDQQMVAAARAAATLPRVQSVPAGAKSYRLLLVPLDARDQHFVLAGAYPLDDIEEALRRVRDLFSIAIPFFVVIAAIAGYFLAGRSLAPVQASFEQQRRFMADASHELRTPTAILRTEADVTLSREHRSEAEYRESVGVMGDAARRLTRIVDDLFLLARADSGHLVRQNEALYVDEIVHGAVRSVRPVAEAKQVVVRLDSVVDAPSHGDADLIGRVLLNLLDNAIKHAPSGGEVAVTMARRDAWVDVRVTDNGPGIPPEAQPHVFERFFRGDPARDRSEGGSSGAGLGLAIAHRIVELHGGVISLVGSRAGHTEFLVSLPVG